MEEIKEIEDKSRQVFEAHKEVGVVYLFGSRVNGRIGPLSDYDFGVYAVIRNKKKIFELKLKLMSEINRVLKTDSIDIVMLNTTENPELKYRIIQEGRVIFEREPFRIEIEPRILNEYFDFKISLERNGVA